MIVHDEVKARGLFLNDEAGNMRLIFYSDPPVAVQFYDSVGYSPIDVGLDRGREPCVSLHPKHMGGCGAGVRKAEAGILMNDPDGGWNIDIGFRQLGKMALTLMNSDMANSQGWYSLSLRTTAERTARAIIFGPDGPPTLSVETTAADGQVVVRDGDRNEVGSIGGE